MTNDWIFRVGNGDNFIKSSPHRIWGMQTNNSPNGKHFVKNVKPGDRLWFVKSKSHGKIIAVATYRSHNKREFGPLISVSMTNEELGWVGEGPDWTSDTEVHYSDLFGLTECEMLTHIKGAGGVRLYNEKCRVNLPVEYSSIVRYSKVVLKL